MARDRSIVVRLRAEVSDFKNQMGQAARTLTDFEREQQKMGGAASTTMGRLVQSAKINEREWGNVGRTLLGIGGAITGVGVAALKSGIEYNTLQQTSRAALTTITGSAAEANKQMDRLDAFARTSPFAKQVFITAQQQMLGFGIEARKVIPYMDAIQNAVAATGGSNQDIAELATVFSQVHANAKITARELMMFGQRGVDAATIIGEQMGKTGGQIRADITSGALDAGEALDALAAGMQQNFGGAADNIKNTIDGAFDRVKAAWRDLSAELAAPLVGQEGGGLLIGWLNSVADAMRSFQAAPGWFKGAIAAIGGLTGVVTLGAGAALLAAPKYFEFRRSIEQLSATHPNVARLDSAVGKLGRTLAVAAAGWAVASAAGRGLAKVFIDTAASANELEVATRNLDFDIPFEHMARGYNDFESALRTLTGDGLFDKMDRGLSFIIDGLTGGASSATLAREGFAGMGQALQAVAESGDMEEMSRRFSEMADRAREKGVAYEELLGLMPAFRDYLIGVADAAGLATDDATLLAIATGELEVGADGAAGSVDGLAESTEELTDAQIRAAEEMDWWIELVNEGARSFGGILSAYDAVIDKNKDLSLSNSQTMDEWIAELEAQAAAVENWRANFFTALDQIRHEVPAMGQGAHREFVNHMMEAGVEGAAALQTFVDGTPAQRAELVAAWQGSGEDIQELIEKGLKPIPFDVDTSKALSDAAAMMGDWEDTTTTTKLDVDPIEAAREFARTTVEWEDTSTVTALDLDAQDANQRFDLTTQAWIDHFSTTNLDLNADPAVSAFDRTVQAWQNQTTNTNLGLNTSGATDELNRWKSRNQSFTLYANVRTVGAPAGAYNPNAPRGLFSGGRVPGLHAGGMVPGPRAGYDNVTWPLHSGGRVLAQPLEGGEYVVRSSQVPKYLPALEAMNAGRYQAGSSGSGGVQSAVLVGPVTLVDESGALLGRMRVEARGAVDAFRRDRVRGRV